MEEKIGNYWLRKCERNRQWNREKNVTLGNVLRCNWRTNIWNSTSHCDLLSSSSPALKAIKKSLKIISLLFQWREPSLCCDAKVWHVCTSHRRSRVAYPNVPTKGRWRGDEGMSERYHLLWLCSAICCSGAFGQCTDSNVAVSMALDDCHHLIKSSPD